MEQYDVEFIPMLWPGSMCWHRKVPDGFVKRYVTVIAVCDNAVTYMNSDACIDTMHIGAFLFCFEHEN